MTRSINKSRRWSVWVSRANRGCGHTLGLSLLADLILIDDRKGAALAVKKGFEVTGTLEVLTLASRRGLLDLPSALARLKETNFHYRQELFDKLLSHDKVRKPSTS